MNYVFTESTIDAIDALQRSLAQLLSSLKAEPEKHEAPIDVTVYAVPQSHPGEVKAETPDKPKTTLEEVRSVLGQKAREGKTALVKMLLERFHAAALTEVDPADYADLLEAGKAL